jgi:hypothetical protein
MNDYDLIPTCLIHPKSIVLYNQIHWNVPHAKGHRGEHLPSISKDHNNIISDQAKRKLNRSIDYFLLLSKGLKQVSTFSGKTVNFRLTFVTLTLSSKQVHSDNEIKSKLLDHFLTECRSRWHVEHYLWRAEKQKNGNIHFHVLTNKFIGHQELRDTWNRIQNKLGYVNRYRSNMKEYHKSGFTIRPELLRHWPAKAQKMAYTKGIGNDWSSPNSTDIHSIRFVNDVRAYFCKYLTKNEPSGPLNGRLWSCSESLSKIPGASLVIDSAIQSELSLILQSHGSHTYDSSYFSVIKINLSDLIKLHCTVLVSSFSEFFYFYFYSQYSLESG